MRLRRVDLHVEMRFADRRRRVAKSSVRVGDCPLGPCRVEGRHVRVVQLSGHRCEEVGHGRVLVRGSVLPLSQVEGKSMPWVRQ